MFLCSPPLSFLIWPSETWPKNQPHSSSSPCLPRPQLTPLLAHWQLEPHPSDYPPTTGTWKMPITLSSFPDAPWRTGSFSTTFQLTVRTTSDMSSQPWEPNPWRCMHSGCLLETKRNKGQPRQKLLLSLTRYNREWHMMSTPMYDLEDLRMLWPGLQRTPKILLHTSNIDGLLQDDQWWTLRARAASLHCTCLLPWRKAPQQAYGQILSKHLLVS